MNIKLTSPAFYTAASIAATYYAADQFPFDPLLIWFICINLITFIVFGKDKLSALMDIGRTPECTFLWLGLLGAWPGLFIGRIVFNHKTSKAAFYVPMFVLFMLEAGAALYFYKEIEAVLFPKQTTEAKTEYKLTNKSNS